MEKMNDNVKSYKEILYMYVIIILCNKFNQATNVALIPRVTTHGPLRTYILQVIFCFWFIVYVGMWNFVFEA